MPKKNNHKSYVHRGVGDEQTTTSKVQKVAVDRDHVMGTQNSYIPKSSHRQNSEIDNKQLKPTAPQGLLPLFKSQALAIE